MPYSITTKDGITINNIPDDVAPDSPVLKERVAALRAAPDGMDIPTKKPEPNALVEAIRGTPQGQPLTTDPNHAGLAQRGRIVDAAMQANKELSTNPNMQGMAATGLLEAGANAVSGLGSTIAGGLAGLASAPFVGVDRAAEISGNIQESGTYQPRTGAGKLIAEAGAIPLTAASQAARSMGGDIGEVVGGEKGRIAGEEIGGAVPAAALTIAGRGAATKQATAAIEKIRASAPAIAARVQRTLNRNPETPTPGTMASGGSAGTDMATQRIAAAQNLPVPIDLTEGQATLSPDQLRFEIETSKGDKGAALRERAAETNERFAKNFDAFVDRAGAEAADAVAVGKSVEGALMKEAARDKAEIRVAYKNADKAGETAAPVTLVNLVDHLNESAPDAATAPLLNTARQRALSLGIAVEDGAGQLVPVTTTLKNAERMRQVISGATDYTPTNVRQSAIIKGLIDSETENIGGPLYRQARRTRENYAKKYENRAIVESLLNKKKGSSDRQVALEDTFKHVILDGSREDLSYVRAALTGKNAPEGVQAWKDLQGATVNWIKDEALKNSAIDQRGNRIVSAAALDKSIRRLEQGGKLDFVFGKKGAQQMRDINDIAKVTMTAPPGVVNTSNTASVLMAALAEAGVTGSIIGLPVPVMSGLRLLAKHSKDKKLKARIDHALNNPQKRVGATPPTP